MIIYELNGYKKVEISPSNAKVDRSLIRKNLTYVAFKITDWEKDKKMLSFLATHMDSGRVEAMIHLVEGKVADNKTTRLHLIIRQDDDMEEFYGRESIMLTNRKPKDIDSFIVKSKMTTYGDKNLY